MLTTYFFADGWPQEPGTHIFDQATCTYAKAKGRALRLSAIHECTVFVCAVRDGKWVMREPGQRAPHAFMIDQATAQGDLPVRIEHCIPCMLHHQLGHSRAVRKSDGAVLSNVHAPVSRSTWRHAVQAILKGLL